MKRTLTLALFLFQVIFFGFFLVYLICVPFYLLGFLWKPSHRAGTVLFQWAVRYTVLWPLVKCQVNVTLPRTGVFTLSNHRSTLDIYILLSYCPGIRIISKQFLFYIPFLGLMMKLMGHISLRSGDPVSYRKAFEKARQILKEGGHVHVFPEMTRCPKGYVGTQEFHLTPFQIARDAAMPLVPLVILNTDLAWPKNEWGMDCQIPLRVKALDPIQPGDYATAGDLRGITQKRMNEALGDIHDH